MTPSPITAYGGVGKVEAAEHLANKDACWTQHLTYSFLTGGRTKEAPEQALPPGYPGRTDKKGMQRGLHGGAVSISTE